MQIPWSNPFIEASDSDQVAKAIQSTWISGGKEHAELTQRLCEYLQTRNLALTSNGTSAIQLAFLLINLEPGDEVLVPAFGFMAAANLVKQMKADPTFVDVDSKSWCISRETIQKRITRNTKAVVLTHSYGNCDNLDEILEFLKGYPNTFVIEDSAEALASEYKGIKLGTLGDFGTYSFHATKLITTGEGGAITWKREDLTERLKLLVSHGLDRKRHYVHQLAGNNFRMSNINASLGLSQFQRITLFANIRKEIDELYRHALQEYHKQEKIEFQSLESSEIVPWSFPVKIKTKSRSEIEYLLGEFQKYGIEVRPGFASPEHLGYFGNLDLAQFPTSIELSNTIISLPAYPGIGENEVSVITDVLKSIIPH